MRVKSVLSGLALLAGSVLASAHHSTNAIYDESRTLELSGTVKEWRFINPHPSLIMEVRTEDGSVQEWDVSYGGAARTHLARRGYSDETFKPGDELILRGHPARLQGVFGLLIEGEDPRRADGQPVL